MQWLSSSSRAALQLYWKCVYISIGIFTFRLACVFVDKSTPKAIHLHMCTHVCMFVCTYIYLLENFSLNTNSLAHWPSMSLRRYVDICPQASKCVYMCMYVCVVVNTLRFSADFLNYVWWLKRFISEIYSYYTHFNALQFCKFIFVHMYVYVCASIIFGMKTCFEVAV